MTIEVKEVKPTWCDGKGNRENKSVYQIDFLVDGVVESATVLSNYYLYQNGKELLMLSPTLPSHYGSDPDAPLKFKIIGANGSLGRLEAYIRDSAERKH